MAGYETKISLLLELLSDLSWRFTACLGYRLQQDFVADASLEALIIRSEFDAEKVEQIRKF